MNTTTPTYLQDATRRFLTEREDTHPPTAADLRAFIETDGAQPHVQWVEERTDEELDNALDVALTTVQEWLDKPHVDDERPDGVALTITVPTPVMPKLTPRGVATIIARMSDVEVALVAGHLADADLERPMARDTMELEEQRRRASMPKPDPKDKVASALYERVGAALDATDEALRYVDTNQSALAQAVFVPAYNLLTRAQSTLADVHGRVATDG